jgi:hypothetical protein
VKPPDRGENALRPVLREQDERGDLGERVGVAGLRYDGSLGVQVDEPVLHAHDVGRARREAFGAERVDGDVSVRTGVEGARRRNDGQEEGLGNDE